MAEIYSLDIYCRCYLKNICWPELYKWEIFRKFSDNVQTLGLPRTGRPLTAMLMCSYCARARGRFLLLSLWKKKKSTLDQCYWAATYSIWAAPDVRDLELTMALGKKGRLQTLKFSFWALKKIIVNNYLLWIIFVFMIWFDIMHITRARPFFFFFPKRSSRTRHKKGDYDSATLL